MGGVADVTRFDIGFRRPRFDYVTSGAERSCATFEWEWVVRSACGLHVLAGPQHSAQAHRMTALR